MAALLARIIFASIYDVFVYIHGEDVIVPDSRLYSARGRYVELLMRGFGKEDLARDPILAEPGNSKILAGIMGFELGGWPRFWTESNVFVVIVGAIYFVFGYFPLAVRIFNIALSVISVYLLFRVATKQFGELAANMFLVIALFLPTQVFYSLTLSRDFMRVFIVALIVWVIYG